MKQWWDATNGIRLLAVCWIVMVVGLVMVGCGGSSHSEETVLPEQEPEVSWSQEAVENENLYFGDEAARVANEVCEGNHGGVRELFFFAEEGLELVVCEDGHVGSPYE